MNNKIKDFPKIESPFARKIVNEQYVATPEITEGYEWVFNEGDVICTEKLHGTNCSIVIENGVVSMIFNRANRIPFIGGTLSKIATEGVNNALEKERFILNGGQHFGELIGPKLNGNPYHLEQHEWIPFDWAKKHLAYKSWGKYPKDFQAISKWLKDDLFSLFLAKKGILRDNSKHFVEGIVFWRNNGEMAKIRRDMFEWFKGKRHEEKSIAS